MEDRWDIIEMYPTFRTSYPLKQAIDVFWKAVLIYLGFSNNYLLWFINDFVTSYLIRNTSATQFHQLAYVLSVFGDEIFGFELRIDHEPILLRACQSWYLS